MREYKEELKCRICRKSFKHLGSHIWHRHKITAREYKEEFGLPYNMPLISRDIYEKKSRHFEENREKYLKGLSLMGTKYQFKKGQTGQRRISDHEREEIEKRILEVNKRHQKPQTCPVCKSKYNHIESHLYQKHSLIKIKKWKPKKS